MTISKTVSSLLLAGILLGVAHQALGQSSVGEGGVPLDGERGPPDGLPEGSGPPGRGISTSSALSAECDSLGASADYSEAHSGNGSTMERNTVSASGCPNHVNWALNPNTAREVPSDTIIPAYPMLKKDGAITDLSAAAGAIGIMFNGVSLFSSWARDTADTYETSAFFLESDTFDLCGGHASPGGHYHYHSTAGCLQEQAMAASGLTTDDHSPQLGWSYDGFPVYGQLGLDGVEMKMCDQEGADLTYCLDSCSGYEGSIEADDFLYRYYTSCGFDESFFPYTTNCYRGCCPDSMACDEHVEACGDSPEVGYNADTYVPSVGTALTEPYDANLISGDDASYLGSNSSVDCSLYVGGKEPGSCSKSVLTEADIQALTIYDRDIYMEPDCVNGTNPLPFLCNYLGIGQECRGCFLTCDGVWRWMEDFVKEYAQYGDALINFCPGIGEVDVVEECFDP